jgi:hypothetical protein
MRLRPLVYLVVCFTAATAALAAAQTPAPPPADPNEPIATRQNVFSIPYRPPRPKAASEQPVEVQLQVSVDLGVSWQIYAKAKPDQGSFVFRAPHDGEYWFSLRTLDKQGKSRPDGPLQPELRVVVDTVPPRLDLAAVRGAGGEVIARWQIVDPNLKAESLKIEVQSGPDEPWQGVAIDTRVNRSRYTLVGQTTCWPKPGKGPITVRAQVSDRAGNLASSQTVAKAEGAAPADHDKPSNPEVGGPRLGSPRLGDAKGPPARIPSLAALSAQANSSDRGAASRQWPADNAASDPLGHRERQSAVSDPRDRHSREADWRASPPAQGTLPDAYDRHTTPAINASNQSSSVAGGRTTSGDSDNRGAGGARTLDLKLLPPGEHPRMVNTRSFALEYEVDSVGTSGIAKVELWGTRDGGRTWSSFGVDSDNRSPVAVNVDGEGIYGFRIVVQSGSGLGGLPPRDGELPEIWVGVDLTKPLATITSANIQADTGELVVRWEASDELPDPRPISLSFSDHANGPWSAIASGLENTGSYSWRLDNRAPEKIYLRLEARDEAGNVGVFVTAEPVLLDRQRPQGRIRNIRPLGEAGDRG